MTRLILILCMACLTGYAQDIWKDVYSEKAWTDRDRWQRPAELLKHLNLQAGSHVADVGCHEGYLTLKLDRAVGPTGKVYAVDIGRAKLERLMTHATSRSLQNIDTIRADEDNPKLPVNALDAVIIVDSYHEMDQHDRILAFIRAALKPDGRLVLCEPIADERRQSDRQEQERRHELGISYALADAEKAGFKVVYREDPFINRVAEKGDMMWLLVLKK